VPLGPLVAAAGAGSAHLELGVHLELYDDVGQRGIRGAQADGADGARMLTYLRTLLENPGLLAL